MDFTRATSLTPEVEAAIEDAFSDPETKPIPPAIQRLMDEVRAEQQTPEGYNRAHNRHNRSGSYNIMGA